MIQPKTEQSGHKRITLFAPVPLDNRVAFVIVVYPSEFGSCPIPQANKRNKSVQRRRSKEFLKHSSPANMVESPHAVNANDDLRRVGIQEVLQHVDC